MILIRVVLVCSVIATAAPASAQPAATQAEALFREGRDLMTAGKVAQACAAFKQSQKIDPAVTTLINLAACHEKLGQLATAWRLFLDAAQQSQSASDDASVQLHKIALDRAAKLEPWVPKLIINVPDKSKLDGLEILRDDENIPAEMWNRALPVDGGTYTITGRASGAKEWSTQVTLSGSDAKTVDIPDLRTLKKDLEERPQTQAVNESVAKVPTTTTTSVASTSGPPSRPLESVDATKRRGGFLPIVGAGAVVLFGSALGFALWGDATYEDAKAEMIDKARRNSLYDSANHKRYAAEGFAVAGVGCVGAAVWLYLRQRSARAETTSTSAEHLMLAPTVSGIGIVGWF